VTIAIVEDHAMMREVVQKVCAGEPGCKVVAEAEDGAAGLELILRRKPDVVVLDLSLPGIDGFQIIARTRAALPVTKILVLSAYHDEHTLFLVEKAGVHGFIDKDTTTIKALQMALRALRAGTTYFSPAYTAARQARLNDPQSSDKILTECQQAVLTLVGRCLNDAEIAAHLQISPQTARTHRRNLLRKLHVKGTPKLIQYALEHGFGALWFRARSPKK
jgi:two-component system response regulator NreC